MLLFLYMFAIILGCFLLSHVNAAELGPRQVCRCFPVDTPDVCPGQSTAFPLPDLIPVPIPPPTSPPESPRCGRKLVNMRIRFIADDAGTLFICGNRIGETFEFGEKINIRYAGGCDDLIFSIENNGGLVGVAVLIEVNGQKYGTTDRSGRFRKARTMPLFGISSFEPKGTSFINNAPDFDFSSWTRAVVVPRILGRHGGETFDELASQGAYPIGIDSDAVERGTYGLRIELNFC